MLHVLIVLCMYTYLTYEHKFVRIPGGSPKCCHSPILAPGLFHRSSPMLLCSPRQADGNGGKRRELPPGSSRVATASPNWVLTELPTAPSRARTCKRLSVGAPSGGAGVHLLQAARPEGDKSVVSVPAEVHEVLQQPVRKLLIPRGTGPPCLGQHGVVGPVVADALLAEHVLIGRAGGVAPTSLLPRELALGVGQLQQHRPWRQEGEPCGSARDSHACYGDLRVRQRGRPGGSTTQPVKQACAGVIPGSNCIRALTLPLGQAGHSGRQVKGWELSFSTGFGPLWSALPRDTATPGLLPERALPLGGASGRGE